MLFVLVQRYQWTVIKGLCLFSDKTFCKGSTFLLQGVVEFRQFQEANRIKFLEVEKIVIENCYEGN